MQDFETGESLGVLRRIVIKFLGPTKAGGRGGEGEFRWIDGQQRNSSFIYHVTCLGY